MKRFVTVFVSVLCIVMTAHAQTYTEHVQQQQHGKGTVTITQSKEIDDIVNGKTTDRNEKTTTPLVKPDATTTGKKTQQPQTTVRPQQPDSNKTSKKETEKVVREPEKANREKANETPKEETKKINEEPRKAEETKNTEVTRTPQSDDSEFSIPTVDMRKKVMRNSYKITGYRVQAFAGGNTRNDKNRAQQIGNTIKMKFPDEPVYVHFYSPRWICRVGNFRTLAEAERMLKEVKAMGYSSATIVKGKISVMY